MDVQCALCHSPLSLNGSIRDIVMVTTSKHVVLVCRECYRQVREEVGAGGRMWADAEVRWRLGLRPPG